MIYVIVSFAVVAVLLWRRARKVRQHRAAGVTNPMIVAAVPGTDIARSPVQHRWSGSGGQL